MSFTMPSITQAQFKAIVSPGNCSPITEAMQLIVPFKFDNVAALEVFRGTFTPADDYRFLFQSLPVGRAPNFMVVLADGHLNISRCFNNGAVYPDTISRFQFQSWPADASTFMNSLYIEGRINTLMPMAQGVPVSYTIVVGSGVIT